MSAALGSVRGARTPQPPDLGAAQWTLLEHVVGVLRPLKDATKFLSAEQHLTVGFVLPVVTRLLQYHLRPAESGEPSAVATLKKALQDDLERRWRDVLEQPMAGVLLLAAFLDPRFKHFQHETDAAARQALIGRAVAEARRLLDDPNNAPLSQQPAPPPAAPEATAKRQRLADLLGEHLVSAAPDTSGAAGGGGGASIESELQAYLRETPCRMLDDATGRTGDPLAWWRAHQTQFPRVAKLARRLLCVPATSTASERAFSKAGWIDSKRRCALSRDNVARLSFIACNFRYLDDAPASDEHQY